jgi:Glycosyltransferase
MKVLHLLAEGGVGGIETLCEEYGERSRHNNIFVFFWGGGIIADEMKEAGMQVIELHATKSIFSITKGFIEIQKVIDKEGVGVLIEHFSAPAMRMYLLFVKLFMPSVKVFVYAHSNVESMVYGGIKRLLPKLIIKASCRKANKVISVSESVSTSLVKCFGVPRSKIVRIYNGVDTSKFQGDNHRGIKQGEMLRLIYVGRLIENKGVQNTLQELAKLPEDILYNFTIVGEGEYRKSLEKMVFDLQINEKIVFLGTRRNVPELLKNADVFIHLPKCEEGFGITLVEAMASGLICIGNKRGAIPETIEDGVSGYIIDDETMTFRDVITKISKADDNKHMSKNAKKRAEAFSIEKFIEKLDDLVDKEEKRL